MCASPLRMAAVQPRRAHCPNQCRPYSARHYLHWTPLLLAPTSSVSANSCSEFPHGVMVSLFFYFFYRRKWAGSRFCNALILSPPNQKPKQKTKMWLQDAVDCVLVMKEKENTMFTHESSFQSQNDTLFSVFLKVYSGSWFLFFSFLEPTASSLIKTCKCVQQSG